ncbi:MAG: DUF4388 domain-containing protein [Myxococcales bacterium]|nr:DUF4388 domain-containing protein [Myxococcales bacterium]
MAVALSGKIQEFGVADILQLIGQQAKTGCLALSNAGEVVHVFFSEGAISYAEKANPKPRELLGSRLVRAGIISREQLREALDEQTKTLKRIGTILTDLEMVPTTTVVEFARLQMMETLYGLFDWHSGTYQFESMDVESWPDVVEAISAEAVVMNGIRMVDEWPSIRAQVPSYGWKVESIKRYPITSKQEGGFGQLEAEQRIIQLLTSSTIVQDVIDRSRLGEFETCRIIAELVDQGYVRVCVPSANGPLRSPLWRRAHRVGSCIGRIALCAGFVLLVVSLVVREVAVRRGPPMLVLDRRLLSRRIETVQRRVLNRALEVYRLQRGAYPAQLENLVEAGLVDQEDLSRPYIEPYEYRRIGSSYYLLTPIW